MCYKTFLQLFYNNSVFVEGKEYNIPNPLKVYRLEFCSFLYIYILPCTCMYNYIYNYCLLKTFSHSASLYVVKLQQMWVFGRLFSHYVTTSTYSSLKVISQELRV